MSVLTEQLFEFPPLEQNSYYSKLLKEFRAKILSLAKKFGIFIKQKLYDCTKDQLIVLHRKLIAQVRKIIAASNQLRDEFKKNAKYHSVDINTDLVPTVVVDTKIGTIVTDEYLSKTDDVVDSTVTSTVVIDKDKDRGKEKGVDYPDDLDYVEYDYDNGKRSGQVCQYGWGSRLGITHMSVVEFSDSECDEVVEFSAAPECISRDKFLMRCWDDDFDIHEVLKANGKNRIEYVENYNSGYYVLPVKEYIYILKNVVRFFVKQTNDDIIGTYDDDDIEYMHEEFNIPVCDTVDKCIADDCAVFEFLRMNRYNYIQSLETLSIRETGDLSKWI